MKNGIWISVSLFFAMWPLLVVAQLAKAPAASPAASQAASAAALRAQDMGRAQRDASKPMQVILEASRIRTKPKAVDTIRLTASAAASRTGAVANAATTPTPFAPAVPIAGVAIAPSLAASVPESLPATRALTMQEATARPGVFESALPTAAGPVRAELAAPARRPVDTAPVLSESSIAAVAVATSAVKAVPVVPKLVSLVEPEIPLRLLSRLAKSALFVVGFRINADGTVGQVAIQSGNFKAMEPSVLSAVQQWRYQPLPQPHDHTVELVINPPE